MIDRQHLAETGISTMFSVVALKQNKIGFTGLPNGARGSLVVKVLG
jgi:hypothetical protein